MKLRCVVCVIAALLLFAFQAAAASDIVIDPVTSASGIPGAVLELSLTVKNNGTTPISAISVVSTALENNGNNIAAPSISDIVDLQAGASVVQAFTIRLPSVPSGTYIGTITVTDKANSANTASKAYSVTVSPNSDFSLSAPSLRIVAQPDAVARSKFTVTNTGSNTLSFNLASSGDFSDEDDDELTLSFSALNSLTPGQSAEVTVTVDVDNMLDIGTYDGTISVRSGSLERNMTLIVEVEPEMCSEGIVGNLEVSIENPDDSDEFKPGDTISVRAQVDNRYTKSMDVIVEAVLYDATDDKKVASVKSAYKRIGNGDSKDFDISLEVPISDAVNDDDDYYLYVRAYKKGDEDAHCNYDRIGLSLQRGEDNVIISDFTLEPAAAKCGDTVTATVTVENIGTDDQENVYIKLRSKELQTELKSRAFSLDRYDGTKTRRTETFEFVVPTDVKAGEYTLVASVEYASDSASRIATLSLGECDYKAPTSAKITLSADEGAVTVKPGVKKFVIPVTIKNTGGKPANIKLDVSDASGWADVLSIEAPETLHGNEEYHAYIYMQLKGNVAEGVHDLRVNVRNPAAQGWLDSKMVSVDVQALPAAEENIAADTTWLNDILSNKSKALWIVGDALLVIVALLFLRMLLK